MMQCLRRMLALLVSALALAARAQTTITVASYPAFDESTKIAVSAWRKNHPDVEIKLVSLAFGDHHKAMIKALASGSNLPDVMAVEIGFLGRLADSGGLEDLGAAPYHGRTLVAKLLRFTAPQATAGTSVLYAVPADVGPGTLFYRKDLLDKAGVTEAELTRSWESFIEAGKKIKSATDAYLLPSASDIVDLYIRTDLEEDEGIYFDKKGNVLVDSPRFRRAFLLARMARRAGLDAKVRNWSNEWAADLGNGTIATQPTGAWMAGHLANWLAPKTAGLWRAAQLPNGAYATWGGSFYAIPKRAEHKTEAWEFIKFLCFYRERQIDALQGLDAWPALKAAQDDAIIHAPMSFLGGQKAREVWKAAAAKVLPMAYNTLDPVAADIVNTELETVLRDGKDIEQALIDAQQQIERRIRR
jgi:multiple sugar transport system substrate-binding protein